jgi:hypothetical protein
VTVSTYLLWTTAALSLISGIVGLSTIGTVSDVYRDAYAGTDAAGSEAIIVGSTVVGVVIGVLFAAALAVLAVFNNRGRNGARITTWVLGGISLCCTGVGLAGTALTSSMNLDTGTGGPSQAEIERRLSEALPSWYDAANWTLAGISLLTLLGALILLALPPSNEFFRQPQQTWDPSMPYPYLGQQAPGYPQYPGQQQPGYPPYPGQPPAPPYPGQQPPAAPPAGDIPSAPPPYEPPPASGPPPGASAAEPPDDRKPPSDPTAPA